MTAVLHTVELFLPGIIRPNSTSFRVQPTPVQVTGAVRRRIAAGITCEQRVWSLAVIAAGLVFGLAMTYSGRQHGLGSDVLREGLRPVLIAGLFLLTCLHLRFSRQRLFVLGAPATTARVIEETILNSAEELPSSPHLVLRYTPLPTDPNEQYTMPDGPCAQPQWAEVEGSTEEVKGGLCAGDRLAILYDHTI